MPFSANIWAGCIIETNLNPKLPFDSQEEMEIINSFRMIVKVISSLHSFVFNQAHIFVLITPAGSFSTGQRERICDLPRASSSKDNFCVWPELVISSRSKSRPTMRIAAAAAAAVRNRRQARPNLFKAVQSYTCIQKAEERRSRLTRDLNSLACILVRNKRRTKKRHGACSRALL